jgi:Ca2+-binding RTX toxin-like protein
MELSSKEHKCPVVPKFLVATETEKNSMASSTNSIQGTTKADTLIGDDHNDFIKGLAGNDRLEGRGGNDDLYGNDGRDTLVGGEGDDTMTGGQDVDLFIVDAGTDTITDLGRDNLADAMQIVAGATAHAVLVKNWGATSDTWNNGTAFIDANGRNVNVSAAGGSNGFTISNEGNNSCSTMTGSAQNDILLGGLNNDTLRGGDGDDVLNGGAGDDDLTGDEGNDTFSVNEGKDHVYDLGKGSDVLNVSLWGAVQADLARDWYSDVWSSNDGYAQLFAHGHNVDVSLAQGTQGWNITNADSYTGVIFYGSALNDTLQGGYGDDILTGGEGADIFVFGNMLFGRDTIKDFNIDEDMLVFSKLLDRSDITTTYSDGGTLFTSNTDDSSLMVEGVHLPKLEDLNLETSHYIWG